MFYRTMKVNPFLNTLNFKGATLNINGFSDAHGNLNKAADFYNEFEKNKKDVFVKEGKGKKNVTAISGDWFMAGNRKGYLSNTNFNSQDYQVLFFNKLMESFKKLSGSSTVIFGLGNHEFDAGIDEFEKAVGQLNADVISTNLDFEKSKKLTDKVIKSKVVDIQDDKDPNLHHKALFVANTPVNMKFYSKDLKGLKLADNVPVAQAKVESKNVKNTIKAIEQEVKKFKQENPQGAVILLDHFGGVYQSELLKKELPINLILSAHEHLDEQKVVGKTLITNLHQNFDKFSNVKIKFGDDGDVKEMALKNFYPKKSKDDNVMRNFYNAVFETDLNTKYHIPSIAEDVDMSIKGVRYQNSPLGNFITDVILDSIKKQHPDTDFFLINSSAIRGSLEAGEGTSVNNLDVLFALNGIDEKHAKILISEFSGQDILGVILDNIKANGINKDRNALYHYSNLIIDKTQIEEGLKKGASDTDLSKFVIDKSTNEPIDLDKFYKVANVEKFFMKSKDEHMLELFKDKDKTKKTKLNAVHVFVDYFHNQENNVLATNEKRYK